MNRTNDIVFRFLAVSCAAVVAAVGKAAADAFAEAATAWLGTRPSVRTVSLQSPARAF
jgi:hypothetical protein